MGFRRIAFIALKIDCEIAFSPNFKPLLLAYANRFNFNQLLLLIILLAEPFNLLIIILSSMLVFIVVNEI